MIMKRIVITLIALAITSMASAFSFSAPAVSGQTLYFTVIGVDSVKVVSPAMNWDGFSSPAGRVVIPSEVDHEGVTYRVLAIDRMAFQNCLSLSSVEIPGSVVSVGQRAFFGDTALTKVLLGEGVRQIDMMAFSACTHLDTIELPSSLMRIAMSAFDNTAYFNNMDHWVDSVMLTLCHWVIKVGNRAVDTLHVPEGIEGIANNAFLFCRYVEKVVLPTTLRVIGDGAFKDCLALDTLRLLAPEPPLLSDDSFDGVNPLPVLVIPCGLAEAYDSAKYWRNFDRVEEMPCPTVIEEVWEKGITVTSLSEGVLVRGAEGMMLTVFDVMGRRVSSVASAQAEQRLPLPATGVYVLLSSDGRQIKFAYFPQR